MPGGRGSVALAGLTGIDDEAPLGVAEQNRVLLTHDVSTMTAFACKRVTRGEPMPGVLEVVRDISIGAAVEDIPLLAAPFR